eukprot:TRINITY_DN5566_c0_g1_i4.p1 TRINITY_DN5566_c0_g1~~TRINITY_DN5566_c0_g1_i4.p1  ORF type:complete len:141 (-),score=1.35 TRINITY_DN5566_c0_g1_i4:40-462(-)
MCIRDRYMYIALVRDVKIDVYFEIVCGYDEVGPPSIVLVYFQTILRILFKNEEKIKKKLIHRLEMLHSSQLRTTYHTPPCSRPPTSLHIPLYTDSKSLSTQYTISLSPLLPAFTIPMNVCLLYTSPSPRDRTRSRMPSSA